VAHEVSTDTEWVDLREDTMTTYVPRYYQTAANDAAWKYLNEQEGNCLIVLPTGAGKSLVIAMLCQQAIEFGCRVVVLQHRRELIVQNTEKIQILMPEIKIGIFSAGLKSRQVEEDVVCAGIQSVYRKAFSLGRRELILIDECFTGETLIDTPNGKRRIDNMRCGDTLYCAAGVGIVKAVSCKPASEIIRIELSNGNSLYCTGRHKIFTELGWKNAEQLVLGEGVFSKQAVCSLWSGIHTIQKERIHLLGKGVQSSEMLLSILCKEIEEPYEQSSVSTKDEGISSSYSASAYQARRERSATAIGAVGNSSCVGRGMGIGGRNSNWTLQRRFGISDVLQDRHCEQDNQDGNRTGRGKSQNIRAKKTGREEDGIPGIVRVVNISREKRAGSTPVFNLHVSGHPSYFANGILAHNCHLVSSSDETMYGQFLSDSKTANPQQRVIGLTATAYRTGEGPLCGRNKLFQRICHESYTGDLIAEGFLCPITNKPADRMVDTSLIKTRGGEFIEHDAQLAFDTTDNVSAACAEIVTKCHDRKSVLVFASGVGHAEHITDTLSQMTGQTVMMVTGETFPMERAATLADFKAGRLRWLVNCDVLTTGFDAPCIDAICVLRATMSPGLFAQMVGRGLRKHESKNDCLVLDFGENIKRHGSLDDRNYGRATEGFGGGKNSSAAENNGRGKECPNCGQDVAARSAECLDCGFVFPVKHEASADHESAITGQTPPEVWNVVSVGCARHTKRNDPEAHPTLRIDYDCKKQGEMKSKINYPCKYELCGSHQCEYTTNGPHIELICSRCKLHQKFVKKTEVECDDGGMMKQTISEWVCIEHSGYARTKAGLWWQARSLVDCPDDITEAIDLIRRGALRNPATITTEREGKYFRIKSVEFSEEKPTAWREADEPVEVLSDGDGFDEAPF
jgi:superfamily II DNA or RNA helicase